MRPRAIAITTREHTHAPPVPIHLPKTNMFARQLMRAAKATKVRDFTHAACVSRGKERTPLCPSQAPNDAVALFLS